ncbi:MAG: DUF4416 family protein [Desulforegulaceae bacterium]|nr:DUF4416 family protein [Desulforegulaceae bacterium]
MSKPFFPKKGLVITALMTGNKKLFTFALKELEKEFGGCFLISPWSKFTHSVYYEDEMGKNLEKRFICFKNPVNQGSLSDIKHKVYQIENKYLEGNKRTLNLDPGILTPDKYVLSTFKNFSHRIYIGDKVFAEVEFTFKNNEPVFFEWTYPDYRQKNICLFFMIARKYLLFFNSFNN